MKQPVLPYNNEKKIMEKMHENELEIDESFVNTLIEIQCPQWGGLPIVPIKSNGADNAVKPHLIGPTFQ
jgi:hypothetical protein